LIACDDAPYWAPLHSTDQRACARAFRNRDWKAEAAKVTAADKAAADKAAADKAAADKVAAEKVAAAKAAADKAAAERAAAEKRAADKSAADKAAAETAAAELKHWKMELDKMANARAQLRTAQGRVRLAAAAAADEDESLRELTQARNAARVALVRALDDALRVHDERHAEEQRRSLAVEAAALQQQQGARKLTLAEQLRLECLHSRGAARARRVGGAARQSARGARGLGPPRERRAAQPGGFAHEARDVQEGEALSAIQDQRTRDRQG
jgi:colicin import membrane protein